MKKIVLIGAALAVLATPAFAQSTTSGNAPAEAKFSTVAKDEMFSSKLKGLNVYNQKDEKVGEITDLAIGKGDQLQAMILSVGGFLGMGEHYVAVSPSSVRVSYNKDKDTWSAKMNTTKDALKAAPEFKYPK
ncbi:PRC-barrel domain-containing protein [soil metagenome]